MKLIVSEINNYWVHFQAGRTENNLVYPRAVVKCYHDEDFVVQFEGRECNLSELPLSGTYVRGISADDDFIEVEEIEGEK